ncbi:hypothetical protein [uncultured Bifidobacterium sp.]|uniref:hypothetical protein n=1 Tax=uncultured Bifidobacterium sp. TaxID=165187 RepID=UPI0026189A3F|nr:hypothetical protein [uncultured Bifidobacterium sp.]
MTSVEIDEIFHYLCVERDKVHPWSAGFVASEIERAYGGIGVGPRDYVIGGLC